MKTLFLLLTGAGCMYLALLLIGVTQDAIDNRDAETSKRIEIGYQVRQCEAKHMEKDTVHGFIPAGSNYTALCEKESH